MNEIRMFLREQWPVLLAVLAAANLNSFALMGIDKRRARKQERRIPERNLFLSALLFGGLGAVLGMQLFRHKTKHWYFAVGMPVILLLQAALLIVILK